MTTQGLPFAPANASAAAGRCHAAHEASALANMISFMFSWLPVRPPAPLDPAFDPRRLASVPVQLVVERGLDRAHLDVAPDPQRAGPLGDEGRVRLAPVALELLSAQVRAAAQGVGELDHGSSSSDGARVAQRRTLGTTPA